MEKTEIMISLIRNEISFVALPANDLISALSEKDALKELKFIALCVHYVYEGIAFPVAWKKALNDRRATYLFRKKDIEVIEAFGENFGITDAEGQILNCELCMERLKFNHKEAKRDCDQYSKLVSVLGFLSGLGIIIVFL